LSCDDSYWFTLAAIFYHIWLLFFYHGFLLSFRFDSIWSTSWISWGFLYFMCKNVYLRSCWLENMVIYMLPQHIFLISVSTDRNRNTRVWNVLRKHKHRSNTFSPDVNNLYDNVRCYLRLYILNMTIGKIPPEQGPNLSVFALNKTQNWGLWYFHTHENLNLENLDLEVID
jgi:hypothetical protein